MAVYVKQARPGWEGEEMSTFNMPPGVTTNDIPGNEPEVTLWKRVGYLQMELHELREEARALGVDEVDMRFAASCGNLGDLAAYLQKMGA